MEDKPLSYYIDALQHIDLIKHPEFDRYNPWIGIVWTARKMGIPQEVVEDWSARSPKYDPEVFAQKWAEKSDKEDAPGQIIAAAKACGWDEQAAFDRYCRDGYALDWSGDPWADGWIDEKPEPPKAPAANIHKTERYTALPEHPVIWRSEDMEPLEIPEPEDLEKQREQCLQSVFRADEYVRYVTKAQEKKTEKEIKWNPTNNGHFEKTAGDILAQMADTTRLDPFGEANPKSGVWIGINPLDGKGTCDRNVTDHRLVLVESDHMPLEVQHAYYKAMRLPVMACIHSGGKSLHAWVRIEAGQDRALYDARVSKLYSILATNGFIVDPANKNPSRLSRFPGFVRGDKCQYAFQAPDGCCESWDEWEKWIDELEDKTKLEVLGVSEAEAQPDPQENQEAKSANPGEFNEPMLSLTEPPRPPFPYQEIPLLSGFIEEMHRAKDSPIDFGGCAVLAALAFACQKKVAVYIRSDWISTVSLYIAAFGLSSDGKSPVYDEIMLPIDAYIKQRQAAEVPEIKDRKRERETLKKRIEHVKKLRDKELQASEEDREEVEARDEHDKEANKYNARLTELETELASLPERNPYRPYTQGDITPEAFATKAAEQNGELSVLTDEMEKFLANSTGIYTGNPYLEPFISMYNGKPYERERVTSGYIQVPNATGTILLFGQPFQKAKWLRHNVLKGQGFWSRFCLAEPKRPGLRDKTRDRSPMDENERAQYKSVMTSLLNLEDREIGASGPDNHLLYLSDEALKLFYEYDDDTVNAVRMDESGLSEVEEWTAKHAVKAVRMAALIHCVRYHDCPWSNNQISADEMRAGIKITDYFLAHTKYIYGVMDDRAMKQCKTIVDKLRAMEPVEELLLSKFQGFFGKDKVQRRKENLLPILAELEEANVIRTMVKPNKRGPATIRYQINQRIYTDEALSELGFE